MLTAILSGERVARASSVWLIRGPGRRQGSGGISSTVGYVALHIPITLRTARIPITLVRFRRFCGCTCGKALQSPSYGDQVTGKCKAIV